MNYIVNYPLSALLYTSVVIIITLLSFLAERTTQKSVQITFLMLIILILTLFAGFRGSSVGIDTAQYLTHLERWQYNFGGSFSTEPGLFFLSKLSFLVVNDPQFVLIIIALTINILIVLRVWMLRIYLSFGFAMFVYTTTFYIMTFSGIRQWLAIAIVFFISKYLFEMKYLKFSLLVVVASLFHNSALLALTFPLIDSLASKLKYRKQKITLILFLLLGPLIIISFIIINNYLSLVSDYRSYFLFLQWNGGSGIIIWLKIFLGIYIYISFRKADFNNFLLYNRVIYIYLAGLLISIPGYYFDNLARIGFYFTFFEVILFALLIKSENKKKSSIFIFIIIIFITIIYIFELAGSGRGHIPYTPFWEGSTSTFLSRAYS
ncbi:EpsG family protein [Alkalihalophilus sp. As8PL]|uniref:EpsG family protein n=1 Tax=Alkalihalophilus sp. As8PL TaxID=3237103 RepID=A0AB39BPG5_9BACI